MQRAWLEMTNPVLPRQDLTWKKSLPAASGMENQTTSMVGEQEGPS